MYKLLIIFVYLILGPFLSLSSSVVAEPWLSTRHAQNCAGCHAPGRKNLPTKLRRCTLSCQGCHVNPNGGGLRSHYGKWNEDRWLRSFNATGDRKKKSPEIYPKQIYASKKKLRRRPKVKVVDELGLDEALYDRRDGLEMKTAKTLSEFKAQLSSDDPYFQMFDNKLDAGVDIRWQSVQGEVESSSAGGSSKQKYWQSFLMNTDISLRWRPFYKRWHLVYEGRYTGNPNEKRNEAVAENFKKRNLYLLVDDLSYASYAMLGYYKPIFSHYGPDHTALDQVMLSYAYQNSPSIYNLNFQALTLGASPNVPFGNLHLISKQFGATPNDTHQGIAFNGGGRFVTLGASVTYSFWNSRKDVIKSGEKVTERLEMQAIGGAIRVAEAIVELDIMGISKDVPNESFNQSYCASLRTKYRFWREFYATLDFANANAAQNLKKGKASQMRLGVRSFLEPGVDVSLTYSIDRNQTAGDNGSDTKSNKIMMQAHLYM